MIVSNSIMEIGWKGCLFSVELVLESDQFQGCQDKPKNKNVVKTGVKQSKSKKTSKFLENS